MNIVEKVISSHLVSGELKAGSEVAIRIDHTLTQDSTGTMAYLQLEAMGVDRVKTKRSVAYVDHNMLQAGPENADDHKYLQTVAARHGVWFSRPGNGICHQVQLERFSLPGETLLGSDSHTPTCGAAGMLAIGAGGLDVAVAMAGGAYYFTMPKVCRVTLTGHLKPMVAAKDVILELLRRVGVKGGVGKIFEYFGEGLMSLSVPERATIANMGAETGATTSIFPSDRKTREFFAARGRAGDWRELLADPDAEYDEEITIDLSSLHPMAAQPNSPDNVTEVSKIAGLPIDQVCIGSCTNSSFCDMMRVAGILAGRHVAPNVSLTVSPGSRQVLKALAANGALAKLIAAGARVLECGCGPCIGMGQAPATDAVSLRTFNRNFYGRSGTPSAKVYIVGPETAAVSAVTGHLTDPETWDGGEPPYRVPELFDIDDGMLIRPPRDGSQVEVVRGPNIKPVPRTEPPAETLAGRALIKLGDNITTDHIMPSNAKLLPYRSNIPYLADFCLTPCDEDFPARAKAAGGGFIVAGENYGQGSSREHAALAPLYLGVKAVLAKSFARIHRANLLNNGILPLVFTSAEDYEAAAEGEEIVIAGAPGQIRAAAEGTPVTATLGGREVKLLLDITPRQRDILLAGGLLNYIRDGGV
ncbi:MAG TPA: aconitate hydratase [Candidatus Scatomorpha stercorigallinarum]|nr:aconitate hydratase [Candidatus Scatomorpha stercorigallinarum]